MHFRIKSQSMKELDKLLYNIHIPQSEPSAGKLLVAEPFLRESYFNHAVVCLIDCPPGESAMGLVMNKPSEYTLGDVLDVVPEQLADVRVMCGGPVDENRLFYLHTMQPMFPDSSQVCGDLFIGGDFDSVKEYVSAGMPVHGHIQFYLGYSGWEPQQLQEEIDRNVWAVTGMDNPGIMLAWPAEKMWHRQVGMMGPAYRGWLYHPQYPIMN